MYSTSTNKFITFKVFYIKIFPCMKQPHNMLRLVGTDIFRETWGNMNFPSISVDTILPKFVS